MKPEQGNTFLHPESLGILAILALASALTSVSIDLLAPTLPVLSQAFDDSTGSIKLTINAFYAGFGFAHIFWGGLSDRFGRRKIMLIGICLYGVATFGCISASSLESLLLFRTLQGIGAAVGMILGRAIIRDIYGPSGATRALSTMFMLFVPIPIIAPIVSGYVVSHFNWPVIFWLMEIVAVLTLLIVMFLLMETAPIKSNKAELVVPQINNVGLILSHRFFLKNAITNMFGFATFVIFISNFSYIMTSKYAFTPQQNGMVLSSISFCLAIGVFSVRILVPRMGIKPTIMVGNYLLLGFWSIILLLQLTGMQTLNYYIVPIFFCSFSGGIILSLLPGQAMVPFSHNAGVASSIFGILQYGGSSLLAYLSGIFYEVTILTVTLTITLCAVMTLLSYWFFDDSINEQQAA